MAIRFVCVGVLLTLAVQAYAGEVSSATEELNASSTQELSVVQRQCKSKGCGFAGFGFGPNCKSKGCGIRGGPFGPIYFGGACKSKGCPVPPGFNVPGPPNQPLPPAPPVCCTPQGCLNGYRTECIGGALSPALAAQGYFSASGSCSGPLTEFNCADVASVCTGNRGRCVFEQCPPPPPTAPPPTAPPPTNRPRTEPPRSRPHPIPPPKTPAPYGKGAYSHMAIHENWSAGDDMYGQYLDEQVDLAVSVRQCKSKGCGFAGFNGNCKSKGCGLFAGPGGPFFQGGACKSKGCPVPPTFNIPPQPLPGQPPVAPPQPLPVPVPQVPAPRPGDCCFTRPCNTQRICKCVLLA